MNDGLEAIDLIHAVVGDFEILLCVSADIVAELAVVQLQIIEGNL